MEHKILVMGCVGVGKSNLTVRFIQNFFVGEYDPTVEDSYRRQITVDGEAWMLDILDTAEYSNMRDEFLRYGEGYLFVYSIISRSSFDQVVILRENILKRNGKTNLPSVLVANMSDLSEQRVVSTKEGETLAKSFQCPYIETSAKTGDNVEEAINTLVRTIRQHARPNEPSKKSKSQCSIF